MILGDKRGKKLNGHHVGSDVENHLGQMKCDFPLADAQRDVVHCLSQMRDGDVLAVSGPPGTGKTTMLQSVVADMVVKFLVQYELRHKNIEDIVGDAPFILASSSNNKAITNIIDAFGSGDDDTTKVDLHHRWLCYETGNGNRFVPMAVYCPSASVDKRKIKGYFVTDSNGNGNYAALRDKYYRDSSDFYSRAGLALSFRPKNVEEIISRLMLRIKAVC